MRCASVLLIGAELPTIRIQPFCVDVDVDVAVAGHDNFAMVVNLVRSRGLTAALTCHENQIFETRGVALDTTRNETFSRFARAQRLDSPERRVALE